MRRAGKMEDEQCTMIDDPRPIKSIWWHEGREGWQVGLGSPAPMRIEIYREPGQGGFVPWVAIYVGDKIVARSDCAGASVFYE